MKKNHASQEIVSFNRDVAGITELVELDDQALERVSGGVQERGCGCKGANACGGINNICGTK